VGLAISASIDEGDRIRESRRVLIAAAGVMSLVSMLLAFWALMEFSAGIDMSAMHDTIVGPGLFLWLTAAFAATVVLSLGYILVRRVATPGWTTSNKEWKRAAWKAAG
jgi:hypothetical protein